MSLIGKESEKERERQGGVLKKVFSCQQISKIAQSLTLSLSLPLSLLLLLITLWSKTRNKRQITDSSFLLFVCLLFIYLSSGRGRAVANVIGKSTYSDIETSAVRITATFKFLFL